ncbi:hypothetical protein F5B22DRAFT_647590 [Xylaria bambusicola]|uniref:uncharacterized protein n=1 Tax=Xylaria bambusicola TaxID=326684 RepID=UPI002008D18F|nr:uncharacterized protein F5B22DRAFT_647590 [Xylaria bambusicola]KAI0514550.1 hypothetical protein F5B22DRAFT_647590 [Xylaria bambusicola]
MEYRKCYPRVQALHDKVASLVDSYTLQSCSRVLEVTDEFDEEVASAPQPLSPEMEELTTICRTYKLLYQGFIRDLLMREAKKEHEIYERAVSRKLKRSNDHVQRRQGKVFEVDQGEHIEAALQSLRLEEFLQEKIASGEKHVHFTK